MEEVNEELALVHDELDEGDQVCNSFLHLGEIV